jgi:hypothetical protein
MSLRCIEFVQTPQAVSNISSKILVTFASRVYPRSIMHCFVSVQHCFGSTCDVLKPIIRTLTSMKRNPLRYTGSDVWSVYGRRLGVPSWSAKLRVTT